MNFLSILSAIGKIYTSLKSSLNILVLGMAFLTTVFIEIVEKYMFRDWTYLFFLAVVIFLDTFFGVWWAIKKGEFDIEKVYEVIAKLFVFAGFLVLGHVLTYFMVGGKDAGFGIVAKLFSSMLILYESHSALRNMGGVYPKAGVIQWAEQKLGEIIKAKQNAQIDEPPKIQS